jgi:hypothetical protein
MMIIMLTGQLFIDCLFVCLFVALHATNTSLSVERIYYITERD